MPTRLYQYDSHIEIMNPGGLYGQARPENFPHVNDYRNSAVAEMMRTLNYVNMFNHGVRDVQEQLRENESPLAEFNVDYLTVFSVIVREPQQGNSSPTIQQLVSSLSVQAKLLIMSMNAVGMTASELQLVTNLSPKSKQLFRSQFIYPCIEAGLIAMSYPDKPRHPKQQYALTELGVQVKEELSKQISEQ
jgi:ATP-dependent DNA helicase RecG